MSLVARSRCAGFTLLELLVAFTIATTALGLLFRVHANATATVALSAEYQEATALAQYLIAEYSVTERSFAFTKTGSTAKFEWGVRASALPNAFGGPSEERTPYRIRSMEAEVRWPSRDRERRLAIRTAKPFFEPEP